jgi:hypothetical protein
MRDTTGEQFKVRTGAVSPLIVKPGHNDTDVAPHSVGTVVLKNPRYTYAEIAEAIERTCWAMWPQAYQVRQTSITPANVTYSYALADDVEFLIRVSQDISTGSNNAVFYYGGNQGYPVALLESAPTTISASGKALYLRTLYNATNPILVTYGTVLDVDVVEDGLMADCVILGSVVRLLGLRQIQRAGQDLRAAEPGQPVAYLQTIGYYEDQYQKLLRKLYLQLQRTNPPMAVWSA